MSIAFNKTCFHKVCEKVCSKNKVSEYVFSYIFFLSLMFADIVNTHLSGLMQIMKKLRIIYIYIYIDIKLATVVDSDQKVPFSKASTLMCRGRGYSFPRLAPLYP